MAKITITEYSAITQDVAGRDVPAPASLIARQGGDPSGPLSFTLSNQTKLVRIATDTDIQFDFTADAIDANAPLLFAGMVEFHGAIVKTLKTTPFVG